MDRNRSQRARHRGTEWRPMVSDAGSSRPPSSRPMIDRGVVLPGVKAFSPTREHPFRTRFANISLRRAEFRKANFDGAQVTYAIGICVIILLNLVIPQIMASSRLGEPSTARSHSLLNAIIS